MLNFFSKPTSEDLLNELQKETFNESKANSILEHVDINAIDNDGKTFLHHVCFENIDEPIRWLAKNGIDKDIEDYDGETALTLAIKNNCFESFHQLLQLGVNVDRQNRYGRTAVQEAIIQSSPKFFNATRMYSKNLNLIDKKGRNILFDAVLSENISLIKELLLEDIDKTLLDKEGKPALLLDNVLGNIELLKELINGGVDISLTDKKRNNLLFYLGQSEEFNLELFEFALKNDIDICCVNAQGSTILIELLMLLEDLDKTILDGIKKEKDIMIMIEKLLEYNIDMDIKNIEGQSALILATQQNNWDLVKMLLNYDVDVNVTDINGNTSVSIAAIRGEKYLVITDLLLSNLAKINIKDKNDKTVIEKLIDIVLHTQNEKKLKMEILKRTDENSDYLLILTKILAKVSMISLDVTSKEEPYFFEPVIYGNYNLLKILIQASVGINEVDGNGLNIIYKLMAENKTFDSAISQKRYYASLKSVLDMRANVNALDSFGGNTLHKAILDNDSQTVKMLINSNPNMEAKDKQGRNYLHNSIWKNRVQIMRIIHSINSKLINTPDNYGVLPINYAAFLGYTDLVLELITLGSVINNTYPKKPYILEFLKRFHKNITPMIRNTKNSTDQKHVTALIKNMKEEFGF